MFSADQIETIVNSHLTTMLWTNPLPNPYTGESSDDEFGYFEDDYDSDDATPELRAKLTEEVEHLNSEMSDELRSALETYIEHFGISWPHSFGHDLALTRDGHGAGFWDRGLGEAGDVLTKWAESLGTLHVFHGHDSINAEKWEGMFHAE